VCGSPPAIFCTSAGVSDCPTMARLPRSVAAIFAAVLLFAHGVAASVDTNAQSLRGMSGGENSTAQQQQQQQPQEQEQQQQEQQKQQAAESVPTEEAVAAGSVVKSGEQETPTAPEAPLVASNGTADADAEASFFCRCGRRRGGWCCGRTWIECCQYGLFIQKCKEIKRDPRCYY